MYLTFSFVNKHKNFKAFDIFFCVPLLLRWGRMPGSQPTDASIWIFSFIFQCKPQLAIHWLKRNMKYIFKRNKSFVNEQKFAIFILINGFWTQTSILHFLYSFDLVSFRFRFGSFSFSLLWWTFFFFTFFFHSPSEDCSSLLWHLKFNRYCSPFCAKSI